MKLKVLFDSLKLTHEAQSELNRVLAMPEVESAFAREQERNLAQRIELKKKLMLVPGQHRRKCEEAGKAHLAAIHAVATAQENLVRAKKDEAEAMVANYAASLQQRTLECQIMNELFAGRDFRLDDLRRYIERSIEQANDACTIWVDSNVSREHHVQYGGNIETCQATVSVLRGLLVEINALCHDAISSTDMSVKMEAICRKAQAALDPLRIVGPTIGEEGEVKSPTPTRVLESEKYLREVAA